MLKEGEIIAMTKKRNCHFFCLMLAIIVVLSLSSCGPSSKGGGGGLSLTVTSDHGPTNPSVGVHRYPPDEPLSISAPETVSGPTGTRYVCTGWTGGTGDIPPNGTGNSYSFAITQNSTITWTWKTQYQLTTTPFPTSDGTITRSPDLAWYDEGTTVQLTANANDGLRFNNWSGGLSGTENPKDLAMNSPKTVTANFVELIFRTITVTSPYGAPDPPVGQTSNHIDGISVTVRCGTTPYSYFDHPSAQYVCMGWKDGSGNIPPTGFVTSYTFIITQDCTITWEWKTQYRLATCVEPSGAGTMAPLTGWYDENTVLSCSAGASDGYMFLGWSGNLQGSQNPKPLTMSGPKAVTANFEPVPYTVTVTSAHGEPNPAVGPHIYPGGSSVILSCGETPYPPSATGTRYLCMGWTGGTGNIPATGDQTSCAIDILTQNSAITWAWSAQYQLTTAINTPDTGSVIPVSGNWYDAGTCAYCNASAVPGWKFVGWGGDASSYGTQRPINLLMNGPKSIIANFFRPILTVLNPQGYDAPNPPVGDNPCYADSTIPVTCSVASPTTWGFNDGFESGNISGWTPGGNANWSAATDNKHSGTYSAKSGAITHSQNTYIQRTFTIGAGGGSVTFWWKVGSETNDYLRFYIDGAEQAAISGTVDWELRTFALPAGSRTLKWEYKKDAGTTTAPDCGWIDDIIVTNAAAPANTRYVCTGWKDGTGDIPATGTETSYTFIITQNSSITWTWKTQYCLTVSVSSPSPATGGTVTCNPSPSDGYYDANASVQLTGVPNPGFVFSNWSGDLTGAENPKSLTMNSPKSVTANFTITTSRTVTVASPYGAPNPPVGTAYYPDGYSVTCSVPSPVYPTLNEGFEAGNISGWTTGGNANWFATTDDKHSGAYSARSGAISGDQSTYIQKTFAIVEGGGQLSFWWKVSSEPNCDWLQFYIDGQRQDRISGSPAWAQKTFSLAAGVRTLTWVYTKDRDNFSGSDCGWIDDISVTNSTVFGMRYACTGWTGTGSVPASGTTNLCQFTITQDSTITWNWKIQHPLTTAVNPAGTGTITLTPESDGWYDANTVVSCNATPDPAWLWENWSGDLSGTERPQSLTIDVPKSITANFIRPLLTVQNPNGPDAIYPSAGTHAYYCGTSVTCSATSPAFELTSGPFAEGFESSIGQWWTSGGSDAKWAVDRFNSHSGFMSARSGAISEGGSTYIEKTFTIEEGGGTVTFWWKIDAGRQDYLEFYVNNELQPGHISGSQGWTQMTFPLAAGTRTLRWAYQKNSSLPLGSDCGWIDDVTVTNVMTFTAGFEAENIAEWTRGDNYWHTTTDDRHSGTHSAESGGIGNNDDSYIERTFTIEEGGGTVTFWWKVSSEPNADYLRFYIDGSEQAAISGEVNWESRTFSLTAGDRTLRWAYRKNGSLSSGSDCGWIDDITVTNLTYTGSFEHPYSYYVGLPEGWPTGGGTPEPKWFVTGSERHSGTYSARSGAIGDSQSTYIERTFIIGEGGGTVSFWWKVNCDDSSWNDHDSLEFWIDTEWQTYIMGEAGWEQRTFPLAAGAHTLKWRYAKNDSKSEGSDCGWIDDIQVTNTVVPYTNYVCTGYTGTGDCPSGSGTSVTFTITQNSSITWNWKTQHRLTVSVLPELPAGSSGTVTCVPSSTNGYYDAGTVVTLTANGIGTYVFSFWSGDLSGTTNPQNITMNGPKNVTANFRGLACILTVNSAYGFPDPSVGTHTYDAGIPLTVSCGTTPVFGPAGTRYLSTGWVSGSGDIPNRGSGTSYSFTITQHSAITWSWQTQYQLTIVVNPTDGGTSTPASGAWYNANAVVSCNAYANPGYGWVGWGGDASSYGTQRPIDVIMDRPKTIIANFIKPTLTVSDPRPPGYPPSAPDPGAPAPPVGTQSCSYGASLTCSVSSPWFAANPTEIFNGGFDAGNLSDWTTGGDANWFATSAEKHAGYFSARSGAIGDLGSTYIQKILTIPTGGGTLTFYWKVSSEPNYDRLRFDIDGSEQAAISGQTGWEQATFLLSAGIRTLRWRYTKDVSYAQGSDCGWVDTVVVTVTPNTRYVCTGYTGTGSCLSGSASSVTFTITQNSSITWNWKTQYRLVLVTNPVGAGAIDLFPPSDTYGYYDAGLVVTLTASAFVGYQFGNWSGGLTGTANPQDLTMDRERSVTANFIGPTKPADLTGTATGATSITWSWTGNSDWQAIAGGVLRTIAATLQTFQSTYLDLPASETCLRTGTGNDRLLFEASDDLLDIGTQDCPTVSAAPAQTYTITYTKVSSSSWTCTADTDRTDLKDYYIDETGVLTEAPSTGDGPQANSGSPLSPDNVWFEIQSGAHVGPADPAVATVYPNLTSYQETGLSENTQYTRHVHAYDAGTYSDPTNDASRYTLVHNATTDDLSLAITSPATNGGIGSGTNSHNFPIDISYNYARCQMLYLTSEMGSQTRVITRMRFQRAAGDADTVNIVKIYMFLVPSTKLDLLSWEDTLSHIEVYSGNLSISTDAAGTWFEIPLTTSFYYDGTKGIIISFRHQDGTKEPTYTTWRNHKLGPELPKKCVAGASDTVNPPAVSAENDRPNIQFEFAGTITITATPPLNSTAGSTGVRIERSSSETFSTFTLIQSYAPVYTLTNRVGSGVWWYRIRFRNADAVESAYSPGKSITVLAP
jgi:hypothetical protein